MSEAVPGDGEGNGAAIERKVGPEVPQREGILLLSVSLSIASLVAASVSVLDESNLWFQFAPIVAIAVLCLMGLYIQSRRIADLPHEVKLQVGLSITVYFLVWIAASGFSLASIVGPSIGIARTSLLYSTSYGVLIAFAFLLVRGGVMRRENRYCLGLAGSTLLAGAVLPFVPAHYCYPLAHCSMAFGFSMAAEIQWVQGRKVDSVRLVD